MPTHLIENLNLPMLDLLQTINDQNVTARSLVYLQQKHLAEKLVAHGSSVTQQSRELSLLQ